MKDLIEAEIEKKYGDNKMAKGGVVTYRDKYNKKYDYPKGTSHDLDEISDDTGKSKKGLQQIYNKGIGAYKTNPQSVRPNVKSKEQWAMGRVYSAVMGGKAARIDAKELKMAKGGELAKGIKVEKEHIQTANKLYNREITPKEAAESVAREHLKENPNYYTKLIEMEKKMAGGGVLGLPSFQMKTPNGKQSKLTYVQQILVRTQGFKDWFGDWESAAKKFLKDESPTNFYECFKDISKIMDWQTLEPRVVFHGTRSDDEFFEFNTQEKNSNKIMTGRPYGYFAFNLEYADNFRKGNQNWSGMYNCFVSVKNPLLMIGEAFEDKHYNADKWLILLVQMILMNKYPNQYIDIASQHKTEANTIAQEIYPYLQEVEMSVWDDKFPFWKLMAKDMQKKFKEFMVKYQFDGVLYTEECCSTYDVNDPSQFTKAVTIFYPNQVKLADGRNTKFNSNFDDMRFENGGVVAQQNLKSVILGNKYEQGMEYEQVETKPQSKREYLNNIFNKMKR
jgi:hypothetical protein